MTKMLDADQLCNQLLPYLRPLAEDIVRAMSNPDDLKGLDAVVRERILDLGDRVMQAAVEQVAAQSLRDAKCVQCHEPMAFKQHRSFQLRTACTGKAMEVWTPYAVCSSCHRGQLTLRDMLGVNRQGMTPELVHKVTLAGALEPYETAAESVLADLAGIHVSGSGVHSVCQQAGTVVQELMNQGTLGAPRPLKPGETLYVECDGLMLWRDDGWHEVKLAVLFPSSSRTLTSKERHQITERQYVVSDGAPDALGALLAKAVQGWLPKEPRAAAAARRQMVFLSDGAPWLRLMAQAWLPGVRIVLDFYHVAEHIATAARALHPDDELARRRWQELQRTKLLDGEVDQMLGQLLLTTRQAQIGAHAREELVRLHSYLQERRANLSYQAQRAMGLDIGSGPAESAANFVLQQRMKRAGMRWDRPGCAAMAALRCAYRSTGGMAALRRARLACAA